MNKKKGIQKIALFATAFLLLLVSQRNTYAEGAADQLVELNVKDVSYSENMDSFTIPMQLVNNSTLSIPECDIVITLPDKQKTALRLTTSGKPSVEGTDHFDADTDPNSCTLKIYDLQPGAVLQITAPFGASVPASEKEEVLKANADVTCSLIYSDHPSMNRDMSSSVPLRFKTPVIPPAAPEEVPETEAPKKVVVSDLRHGPGEETPAHLSSLYTNPDPNAGAYGCQATSYLERKCSIADRRKPLFAAILTSIFMLILFIALKYIIRFILVHRRKFNPDLKLHNKA